MGVIEKVYNFFNTPKRNSVLLNTIENSNNSPQVKQRLCATSWIQRYDSVNDFSELFSFVLNALDIISDWKESTDAEMLQKALKDSEFLISLNVIKVQIIFILYTFRYIYIVIFKFCFRYYFLMDFRCVNNCKKFKLI